MSYLRAPVFHTKIAALAQNNAEALQHLDRLYYTLQAAQGGAEGAAATITAKLDLVESMLAPRLSALEEFLGAPDATAHSVVEAFLAERASANLGHTTTATTRSGPNTTEPSGVEPDASAVYRAIALDNFRKMATAVLSADPESRMGRLNAIAAGFDGNCVLSVRMLCEGNRALSLKHNALGRLFDLRAHIADYLNWCLLADDQGNIPSRMTDYSIVGRQLQSDDPQNAAKQKAGQTFLSQLLKFELDSMDWLNAPGGLIALKAIRDGGDAAACNLQPSDVFTIPEIVNELGHFVHQLLVALGAPKDGAGGYSFAEWTQFYVRHLLLAKKLRTRELRLEHLDRCHEYFVSALRHFGRELRSRVYCAQPDLKSIATPLLTDEDELITTMKEWESAQETALDMLHKFRGMFVPAGASSTGGNRPNEELDDPWILPRRSQRISHKTTEAGGRKGTSPEPVQTRKRERERNANSEGGPATATPGSTTWAHRWIGGRRELLISGRVWNIRKLAAKLKVKPGRAVCWPVVLSARTGSNRLCQCEHPNATGHESLESEAHRLSGFRVDIIVRDTSLWRYPTDEEKEALRDQRPKTADSPPSNEPAQPGKEGTNSSRKKAQRPRAGEQDFHPPSPP